MEALLGADSQHGPRIRAIGTLGQHGLVEDRRAIDKPTDDTHVRPAEGWIIEDARILGLSLVESLDHFFTGRAESLGTVVEVLAMPGLVLYLGQEDQLPPQAGCPGDPLALGEHADDLAVCMLGDHPDQLLAISFGHPISGLDLLAAGDPGLEISQLLFIRQRRVSCHVRLSLQPARRFGSSSRW